MRPIALLGTRTARITHPSQLLSPGTPCFALYSQTGGRPSKTRISSYTTGFAGRRAEMEKKPVSQDFNRGYSDALNPSASKPKAKPALQSPRPSSSVLLISPTNQILLLHRVRTSSAFPSAHVFPGGNVSTFHDGEVPPPEDIKRHEDSQVYRLAAVRETFEESGILLARNKDGGLLEVEESEREEGRRAVHSGKIKFTEWLASKAGVPDTEALIPFTRWVTPPNVPKRFTTQMYLYFLPLPSQTTSDPSSDSTSDKGIGPLPTSKEAVIPIPTPDGGLEHTAARFLPAQQWLELARSDEIILFPPQFFLLFLCSQYLTPSSPSSLSPDLLQQQRMQLLDFVKTGEPPWSEKVISPETIMKRERDGRVALGLEKPGRGLEGTGKRGVKEWVVLVEFKKEGPRKVDVVSRKELFEGERRWKEREGKL